MTDLAVGMKNHLLIPLHALAPLNKLFDELLSDDTKRMKVDETMQGTVCREWSWEHKAEQLESIYAHASSRS